MHPIFNNTTLKWNKFYTGVLLMFLSATGFAVMPILATFAYADGANVSTLLLLRFGIASLIFFLWIWWKRGLRFSLSRRQWLVLFFYGGATYALISTLYFEALNYISGSLTTLLLYTFPIFVVLLSILIDKEVFPKKVFFAILLSMVGMCMVIGTAFAEIRLYGVLLALASAVGYAVHVFLMNRMVRDLPAFITTAFVILFTAVTQLIICIVTDTLDFSFHAQAWASIIGLSFASTILALLTFFAGLQLVGSTNASVLSMLEPILTIILSSLILGESFTLLQMFGTVTVLTGAVIVVRTQSAGTRTSNSYNTHGGILLKQSWEHVRQSFDQVAQQYDSQRKKLIPCFDDFYSIPPSVANVRNESPHILDIGAGTGLFSAMFLHRFPRARLTLIDLSESMLEQAKQRFQHHADVRYIVGDYTEYPLEGNYDLIISSLSIHHLDDEQKRTLYQRIFELLQPGGEFFNADQVLGQTPSLEALYKNDWKAKVEGSGLTPEAIAAAYERTKLDKMSTLHDQMQWLRESGFSNVDCIYKYYNFVVLYGNREL